MSNVFANSLEISGKAVNAKTIAVFPDVCFTPPENPATPPGVPVPYPSFGMASDAENGTSTVKIGGKTVNIKNKSDLSRTSGTEAGCAAKKGVITSKNTGKEYFNSWSNDVKFDGEPVIRMTDLATNNHASPTGNTVTWPHIAQIKPNNINCEKLLNDFKITLHKHSDKSENCGWTKENQNESEHMFQNALAQNKRGGSPRTIEGMGDYSAGGAPCLCMKGPAGDSTTPHGKKTRDQEKFTESCIIRDEAGNKTGEKRPKVKDAIASEMNSIRRHDETISKITPKETQDDVMTCLEAVVYDYLERCTGKKKEEIAEQQCRVPGGDKIPKTSTPAPGGVAE
jgi:hypothetical protein